MHKILEDKKLLCMEYSAVDDHPQHYTPCLSFPSNKWNSSSIRPLPLPPRSLAINLLPFLPLYAI